MNYSVESTKVFKIITKSQISRLAGAHGLDVEIVEDIRQELAFELVDGSSSFNPDKGKFENWLRRTISGECKKAKCGRAIGLDEFEAEDGDGDFLIDTMSVENYEVAANNDDEDFVEPTDNPIWDNSTARRLAIIHATYDLDDPFWQVAMTREGWAAHLGLSLKQADTRASNLAGEARQMRVEGMEPAEILKLFKLENKACGRQRRPKTKRETDTVSYQPELF